MEENTYSYFKVLHPHFKIAKISFFLLPSLVTVANLVTNILFWISARQQNKRIAADVLQVSLGYFWSRSSLLFINQS